MTVGVARSVNRAVGCWSELKESNRKAFFDTLDEISGSKTLVWDSDLLKPFGLIADFSELKAHGVVEMFTVQRGPVPMSAATNVVFVCRPKLSLMELIAENLRSQRKDDTRRLHLLFTPRQSVICENKLNEVDARQRFDTISEVPIFFFASDLDVASMEETAILSDCLIDEDKTALHTFAMGLRQIENVYGPIANLSYKGNLAQEVYRLLLKERQGSSNQIANIANRPESSIINSMIIMDRMIDPMTPMVTQLTYEGLIDEIFKIKCAHCKFPKEKFSPDGAQADQQDDQYKKLQLNSTEDLYQELRDLNFNSVPATLSNFIKTISKEQEERHKATTVHEMKEFVKRLPYLQAAKKSAAIHTTIAELIKDVTRSENFIETITAEHEILNEVDTDKPLPIIEDGVSKGQPWIKMLRLMCLQSLVTDGLSNKVFDQYRREFLQSYGYHLLPLLCKLQKAELLRTKPTTGSSSAKVVLQQSGGGGASRYLFGPIKRTFRLLVDDVDELNPTDLSYIYSGYAPLSSRLCSYYLKPGWKIIADNLKRLAGATGVEEGSSNKPRNLELLATTSSTKSQSENKPTTILVVYVGGVTLAEISALRFLAKQQEEYSFLVLSTCIITGDSLIESFV